MRVIEPYSLRRSRAGHLLLHAIKTDSRQHRSYRVDKIESVRVTTRPFRPVYAVEFASMGPLSGPEIARQSAIPTDPRRAILIPNDRRAARCSLHVGPRVWPRRAVTSRTVRERSRLGYPTREQGQREADRTKCRAARRRDRCERHRRVPDRTPARHRLD